MVPASRPASDLVASPDQRREGSDEEDDVQREGGRAEEVLEWRRVHERRGEDEFEGDAGEQQWVGEEADVVQGRVVGAGGDGRADLAGDDSREGGGGRGEVSVVQGVPGPVGSPGCQPARHST